MSIRTFRKLRAIDNEIKQEHKQDMAIDRNSKFVWTAGADVMNTFKKFGFIPPSEYRNDYLFKKNREIKDE
jgi:hypothetical protein